jgi:hypothetical protein
VAGGTDVVQSQSAGLAAYSLVFVICRLPVLHDLYFFSSAFTA